MPATPDRLSLRSPEFTARAKNFAHLMSVPEFQKRFFENPAAVAATEFGLPARGSTINQANTLVYHLLADKQFNAWAAAFQQRIETEFPTLVSSESLPDAAAALKGKALRKKLLAEFSTSVAEHLDPKTIDKLSVVGVTNKGVIVAEGDVAILLLTFIAVIVVVVVAAGVSRPDTAISRHTVKLLVNNLTNAHATSIRGKLAR